MTDKHDRTPLMESVLNGRDTTVKCRAQNVDVNKKDNYGRTALRMAASIGNIEAVKCLCEMGCVDVNVKDNDGDTALKMAAMHGHIKIVQCLLSMEDIDVNVKDNEGWSVLMMAASKGDIKVLECLREMEGVDTNAKDNDGRTALMMAAINGRSKFVKCLCTMESVDVNAKDSDGWTALMKAASVGHIDVVKYLCSIESIDIDTKDQNGQTALILSARSKHVEVAMYLCSNEEVDVNTQDINGMTALIQASSHDDIETISCLCSNENIDINVKDNKGQTAFLHASMCGHFECVKYLSSLTTFNVADNPIEKLILCALHGNVTALVEFIGSEISVTVPNVLEILLVIASANGRIECVDFLLSTGVNVNGCQRFPRTPLMLAAMNGHTQCVKRLVEVPDVDLNATSVEDGRTALVFAALNGKSECVKLLLSLPEVDIWKEDVEGMTAFRLAIRNGHASCLPLFVDILEHESEEDELLEEEQGHDEDGILHAFCSWTNGTCTGYRPGTTWKCPSIKEPKEICVIGIRIRNGVSLCPFCFVLVGCESREMPCWHVGIVRQFDKYNMVKSGSMSQLLSLTKILQLAVQSRHRKSLDFALRYCRLSCHMLDDLKHHTGFRLRFNNLFPFDTFSFHCKCATCRSPTASEDARRKCADYLLSQCIVLSSTSNPLSLALLRGYHEFTRLLIQNVSEQHKICQTFKRIYELKYVSILLKNGVFEWSWYHQVPVRNVRYLARELVIHGYSPDNFVQYNKLTSPLQHALSIGDVGLVKYLVANLYLTSNDVKALQDIKRVHRRAPAELQQLLQHLSSRPWSLQALSFLSLSSSLQCQRRKPDLMKDDLPMDLHTRLTFTNPIRMLCVRQWDYILSESVTTDAITSQWLHDMFLLQGETFVKPEPESLTHGQCCNGKCRVIPTAKLNP